MIFLGMTEVALHPFVDYSTYGIWVENSVPVPKNLGNDSASWFWWYFCWKRKFLGVKNVKNVTWKPYGPNWCHDELPTQTNNAFFSWKEKISLKKNDYRKNLQVLVSWVRLLMKGRCLSCFSSLRSGHSIFNPNLTVRWDFFCWICWDLQRLWGDGWFFFCCKMGTWRSL